MVGPVLFLTSPRWIYLGSIKSPRKVLGCIFYCRGWQNGARTPSKVLGCIYNSRHHTCSHEKDDATAAHSLTLLPHPAPSPRSLTPLPHPTRHPGGAPLHHLVRPVPLAVCGVAITAIAVVAVDGQGA